MRLAGLLVLGVACSGCASTTPVDHIQDCSADDPPSYAEESARADMVCVDSPGEESTGEAQEPFNLAVALICAYAVHILVQYGCDDGDYFTNVCPPGHFKTIVDAWDKTKKVRISCNALKALVCGTGEIGGIAALGHFCGHVAL